LITYTLNYHDILKEMLAFMFKRNLFLQSSDKNTCFLWGPRQTGKSTLLRELFPSARRYDLLLSSEFRRLNANPGLIREECDSLKLTGENQTEPIIIDEVQKVPEILDEVHWLIENRGLRFILCGSSARKLKHGHGNLLGGRAVRYVLHPLTCAEIPDFSLDKAINNGLLPRHYLAEDSSPFLEAYVGDYLQEEIAAEALTRNLSLFQRFLEVAALSNGEIINFSNIARDCAISVPTVKAYFSILEDTLIGTFLPAFSKVQKRRIITAPKFFFFDVGVLNECARRRQIQQGSEIFGRAFEHLVYMELTAYLQYKNIRKQLTYWRTASQIEVDFLIGDAEVAIEVKSTEQAHTGHLRGLKAFAEEYPNSRRILVSLDPRARLTETGIEILPWMDFVEMLWGGEIIQ
jgi:predicted AAA+ superfamily ATPase